ncbi:hypothetical protein DFQ27_004321 [Actinomortierella ambigua]|uniref:GDP-fucose protein O-fucosyltransferase n=1 Tax=Actinomortierella ambigua TaxID=1343610 RepID=A0A9P6QJ38_9FUNG|nr:hypothetical protein DFQ27_004321 [Actinomortierella ambigua]
MRQRKQQPQPVRLRHYQRQNSQRSPSVSQEEQNLLSKKRQQHQQQQQKRYLVYVPYAGATNQLISIWHASMIAKHLNRTLLLPNLSPNVHVQEAATKKVDGDGDDDDETMSSEFVQRVKEIDRRIKRGLAVSQLERALIQRLPGTRWSRFFDIQAYSRRVGVEIEELDDYLVRSYQERLEDEEEKDLLGAEEEEEEEEEERSSQWFKRHEKRWLGFWRAKSTAEDETAVVVQSKKDAASSSTSSRPSLLSSSSPSTKHGARRVPIFADPLHCYSEGGYGMDRRMDVTGKQFLARYGISRQIRPTPFLNPKLDSGTIWARWRVDKVIERYRQPAFTQGEGERVLCLSHVYRLLPGGRNRAWVEFGQHLKYTQEVEDFVEEALVSLLKEWQTDEDEAVGEEKEQGKGVEEEEKKKERQARGSGLAASLPRSLPPFVGLHLRRGDFERHCLGITSPADPNGWNRCYPSTEHVISLLSNQERMFHQAGLDFALLPSASSSSYSSSSSSSSSAISTLPLPPPSSSSSPKAAHPWPVLVLSNERDPRELAKSRAQGWISVDHGRLGTVDRFGGYGPIMVDGALLARASLLVGVEYSTYFRTASLRAQTWRGGRTLFVT